VDNGTIQHYTENTRRSIHEYNAQDHRTIDHQTIDRRAIDRRVVGRRVVGRRVVGRRVVGRRVVGRRAVDRRTVDRRTNDPLTDELHLDHRYRIPRINRDVRNILGNLIRQPRKVGKLRNTKLYHHESKAPK
jgi:hypothetical protein